MPVLELLIDALKDSAITVPFLFFVYLFMEYLEHKASEKIEKRLVKIGKFGPIGGAIFGCVPQCGFSVAASNLFSGKIISMGTLIAVFIATSDEALPILISNPSYASSIWKLILAKVIIAVLVGFLVDFVFKGQKSRGENDLCENCGCEESGIFRAALSHTLQIFLFIFVVNVVLNGTIYLVGEENLSKVLMSGSIFQPFVAALVGFIPNCASSIILAQLHVSGSLSLGSLVAGLCTGAGLGIAVLFRTNKSYKQNFLIVGILYVTAVLSGVLINLF